MDRYRGLDQSGHDRFVDQRHRSGHRTACGQPCWVWAGVELRGHDPPGTDPDLHTDSDPDPDLHTDADSDPDLHTDADSDPTPTSTRTPTPTPKPSPQPKLDTELTVNARAKSGALLPDRQTRIVRSTRTDGTIKKVTVHCFLQGQRLRGVDARAICGMERSRMSKSVARTTPLVLADRSVTISVQPACTIGLKVRVKIVAKAPGKDQTSWKRSWIVKNVPPIHCAVTATG